MYDVNKIRIKIKKKQKQKNNYKLTVLDLRKQKALGADSWAIHQITFTGRASADTTV